MAKKELHWHPKTDRNLMNELRKNPKIYFVDCGIRNYLLGNFENLIFDKLYENFIHNELKRFYEARYWRTTAKTEVDFVVVHEKEIIPLEVKVTPKIARSFRSFIQHYNPDLPFCITTPCSVFPLFPSAV